MAITLKHFLFFTFTFEGLTFKNEDYDEQLFSLYPLMYMLVVLYVVSQQFNS